MQCFTKIYKKYRENSKIFKKNKTKISRLFRKYFEIYHRKFSKFYYMIKLRKFITPKIFEIFIT
jgi:hypothetical protein